MSTKFFVRAVAGFLIAIFCGVFAVNSQGLAQTSQGAVKWHPGHYITIPPGTNAIDFIQNNPEVLSNNHVKGVLKKIYWGDIEREQGRYDFSEIDGLLEELKKNNKYLFLGLWDRSFNDGCNPGRPMPAYIYNRDGGRFRAVLNHGRNGCTAAIWEPWVMDRFIEMVQSLGARYDRNPNFHGVATAESALGTANGFNKQQYKDQLIRLLRESRRAFPNSLVLATINYLSYDRMNHERNLGDLTKVMQEVGGGISTPDSVPSRNTPFNQVAPAFRGKVAIAPMVDASFVDIERDTPAAINRFNVERLGASFLFWAPWHQRQRQYLHQTVLPGISQIVSNPSRYPQLVQRCPSSFRCAS